MTDFKPVCQVKKQLNAKYIMENQIVKRFNKKILILTLFLVIVSGGALLLNDYSTSVIVFIIAIFVFLYRRNQEVYIVTGSPVKRETYFFEGDSRFTLEKVLRSDLDNNSLIIYFGDNGSGRLDIIISKDRSFAVATISHFVPYKYEQITEPIEFCGPKVEKLASYLKRCNR